MPASIDLILDASTIEAIHGASVATCEILDGKPSPDRPTALTPPRELTADQLAELKRLILDPQSWWFARKKCLPHTVACVRLQGESGRVTVALDRPCDAWIITGPRGRWGGFFDPVRDRVWAIVKGVFAEYASPSKHSLWRKGEIYKLQAAARAGKSGQEQPDAAWRDQSDPSTESSGSANRDSEIEALAACEIHGLPMAMRSVRIAYGLRRGLKRSSGYLAARRENFPHCGDSINGGCIKRKARSRAVPVCPECVAARDAHLRASHPGWLASHEPDDD